MKLLRAYQFLIAVGYLMAAGCTFDAANVLARK
jgi:hypothetical protein